MLDESLYLVLGCNGRIDNGFVTCSSVTNPILLVSNNLEGFECLIKYFKSISLFNRKIINYNEIRNVLFKMNKGFMQGHKTLWGERVFPLIDNFTLVHRPCGTYLSLEILSKINYEEKENLVLIEPKTLLI